MRQDMLYITMHNYSQYNHAHNSGWSSPYKYKGEHSILDTRSQPPYFAWSGLDDDDHDDNNIIKENNDLRKDNRRSRSKNNIGNDKKDKKYGKKRILS